MKTYNELGESLFKHFGTDSYNQRCALHDLRIEHEKLEAQNKELREYARHATNCDLIGKHISVKNCSCGLDKLLTK